jgi:hypothetical protein
MSVDMDEVKSWLENASPLGFKSFKPTYGADKTKPHENRLKLFSWPPERGPLAIKVMKHFGLGADGKRQAICPKTYGIKHACPICDFISAAVASQDASLLNKAKELGARERYYQLCLNWDAIEKEPTAQHVVEIYDCPPKVHRDIMQTMATQKHDFTAFEHSAIIALSCYSQGLGKPKAVDFKVCQENLATKFVDINWEEWKSKMPDLEEARKPLSPARLQALLDGEEDASASEPAKEEPPADEIPMTHAGDAERAKDPDWSASTPKPQEEVKKAVEAPKPATTAAPSTPAEPAKKKPSLAELIAMNKAKAATP